MSKICYNSDKLPNFYRPQRSWGKVVFSQVCVILFTGGVSASVHAGIPPPGSRHPPRADTPQSRHPLGADTPQAHTPRADTPHPREQTPWSRHTSLRSRHPPGQTPPREQTPPQRRACWEIRSTRGR